MCHSSEEIVTNYRYDVSLGMCVVGLIAAFHVLPSAQAQQPAALVIEGGTLIDGTGGAPVPDSVVVIQHEWFNDPNLLKY
jgi:hypothetical protein